MGSAGVKGRNWAEPGTKRGCQEEVQKLPWTLGSHPGVLKKPLLIPPEEVFGGLWMKGPSRDVSFLSAEINGSAPMAVSHSSH